jgi:PAS domain S-box-containing protein
MHSELTDLVTGALSAEQIVLMLENLPVDITYVDENDIVRYFSGVKHRIFPRSKAIIGREVQNCHPPDSVEVVERILQAFRDHERDHADFWINMHGKFIHIRYFALYDASGKYRGTIEVSQDVTGIRSLEGEQRLLDWK